MRVLRLDLLAFGPFTDESLEFGGDGELHIVHGPNEAGKSSSLRALRNLLYGIPERSSDDFVHRKAELRIGGVFEAADGTLLEFIRRKGRTKTLRGPDDVEVFDESQLLTLLGGVDEATFSQRFGIDYEELRRGGESVVCGGGDLGEILFAAGAGVADLRDIQQRLQAEADAMFRPQASKPRINNALSRLKDERSKVREAQLPTSDWEKHDGALRQAEIRQREIDEELTRERTEQSRLDRIHRSLALIGELEPLRETLASLADAPLLPETFPADRREAETNLKNAQNDEKRARSQIEQLEHELSGVDVPTELLAHRTATTQLHTELGSYQKAAKDRPGLVAERDRAHRQARRLLEGLGRPTGLEKVESLRLPKVKRMRIQDLAVECQALIEKQQSCEGAVRKLDDEIALVEKEIQELPAERDVSDLERTIRQVQKHGDLDAQRRTAQAELESLCEQANIDLARLPLFARTLEELETLPIPTMETIDRFESKLADADGDVRRWQEKIEELSAASQQLQGKLDALRLEREVPTEVDLQTVRQRRDAGWALVQQAWQHGSTGDDAAVAAFVDEFAAGGDLATAFRASIEKADSVADRLRREADRVAQKSKLTADLQQTESNLEKTREAREEAKGHRERIQSEWRSQWGPVGVEPLSPREMRLWQTLQQSLAEMAAEIRKQETDLQRLEEQIDSLKADLNQYVDALGQPRVPDQEPLSTALDRCQEIAEQIGKHNQHRERLLSEQKKLSGQQPETERQANDARKALEKWRTEWTEAVAAVGLGGDAKPSEANAVIETVDEVLKLLDESRKLDGRIDGIDEDAKKFEQSVRQLLQQLAPDLLDALKASVERAVADLVDRLDRAGKDQTKVEGWQEQLQEHQTARDRAEVEIEQWEEVLKKLCEQAGCQSPHALPQAEERSKTRRDTETARKNVEQRLRELAAGTALKEWIETAEPFDSDQVQADLTSLNEAIEALESEKQEVSESIGEHRNELSRMDGSGTAAEAQIQAEHLLASIRSDAEEYIRWRLASVVLSRAMERFREASQGPVLCRAAEQFSTLSRGSFAGLRADYDDNGNAILVGVRPSSQTVTVGGMSDGTCDQLYLALRLALLESSLDGREPLPFIVDDILIMFDDDRAAAALCALARLSERTQVVFFTHHDHLVQIARDTLDERTLCVLRL